MYAPVGGTVHTATKQGTIDATVVIDDGDISSLGDVEPPEEAIVIPVTQYRRGTVNLYSMTCQT